MKHIKKFESSESMYQGVSLSSKNLSSEINTLIHKLETNLVPVGHPQALYYPEIIQKRKLVKDVVLEILKDFDLTPKNNNEYEN